MRFKKGHSGYWLGKKRTAEQNQYQSERKKLLMTDEVKERISIAKRGDKAYNWKGGQKSKHTVHTYRYKKWRRDVFIRDEFTCRQCGKTHIYITAHHIKSWVKFPDLRYVVNNGRTLCEECHKKTDNYKGRSRIK